MDSTGLIYATHIHICMHVYNNVKRSFSLEEGRTWKVLEKMYFGGAGGGIEAEEVVFFINEY